MKKRHYKISDVEKKGVISDDFFFRVFSSQCNYIDPAILKKEVYPALVRTFVKCLRDNGIVRLPHIGDFAFLKQDKGSYILGKDPFTGKVIQGSRPGGVYTLQFHINENMRDYFKEIKDKNGLPQKLDVRERLLGQDLQ